jgi:hypothetical protein
MLPFYRKNMTPPSFKTIALYFDWQYFTEYNRKNSDFLPFGVLRSVLAMVGVVAKVVIKVKIDMYAF